MAALVLSHAATVPETPASDESGADVSGRTGTRNGPPWWRPGAAAQRKVEDLMRYPQKVCKRLGGVPSL